jgi:hypothetical protein
MASPLPRAVRLSSWTEMLAELDRIVDAPQVTLAGTWTVSQVFEHCAQSIVYSMIGYPKLRSALFRVTVGRIAKGKFLGQGYMTHDLEAPVPGAAPLKPGDDRRAGATELRDAIASFQAFHGEPAAHLAYGPCTLAEYERIHAMHFANHVSAVSL